MSLSRIKNRIHLLFSNNITSDGIFFIAFLLFFVSNFLQTSMYTAVLSLHFLNYCSYLSMAMLLFGIVIFQNYNINEVLISLTLVIVTLVVWKVSLSPIPFYFSMFAIAGKNIPTKKIVSWYFLFGLITLIFIMVSAIFGLIDNLSYVRGGFVRRSFGIVYPTDFSAHVFYLILAYCYLYFDRLKIKHYLVISLIAIAVYYFCNARLDTICILLIIPTMVITKKCLKLSHLNIMDFSWMLTALLAVLTYIGTFLYEYSYNILFKLNMVLSHRISLSSEGLTRFGVHAFGSHVVEHGWGGSSGIKAFNANNQSFHYFILDSSFVRSLVIYGFIFTVLLIVLITINAYYLVKINDYVLLGIFLLIAVSSVVDQHMLELAYNPFFLGIIGFGSLKTLNKGGEKDEELYS